MCLEFVPSAAASKAEPTDPGKVQHGEKIPSAGGLGPRSDHQ